MSKKQAVFLFTFLIIILGFTVYMNSLNGKFIWDDNPLVKGNVYIKSYSHIYEIFKGAGAGEAFIFYRPIQILTYMIDYSLWKLDVRGYHFSNVLLHICVALAIFWLVTILFDNFSLSLFTSALFVVHPIHTEAVTYISGRADPLALLFMLLCFILYIKHNHSQSVGIYIFMLLSYILALLSRESSLILPALLLLYHYTFKKRLKNKEFLPILGITLIYILLRLTIPNSRLSNISYTTTLLQRIPGFFVAITNYTRLLFLPFNLHMEYAKKTFLLNDPKAIVGILILSCLLIYAFRIRNTNKLAFFSISWFFIALLPQSNLYPINAYMAEHWLYLPSIGFFLILANGLSNAYRRKKLRILVIISTIGLLYFYSLLTMIQNTYWRQPLAFFERTLKYAPDSPRIHNNLGLVYYTINKHEEAISLYKKAIEIDPDYVEAYNNLGLVYDAINNKEEAIAFYKKAIEIAPEFTKPYNNLGLVYDAINNKEEAIASFKKAIELNPFLAPAYNNLGLVYYTINKHEEAISLYKKAIEIDPEFTKPYNNLGLVYEAINNKEEAISSFDKAIELNPQYADAYFNKALICERAGNIKEGIEAYKKFIQFAPHDYASDIEYATERIRQLEIKYEETRQ